MEDSGNAQVEAEEEKRIFVLNRIKEDDWETLVTHYQQEPAAIKAPLDSSGQTVLHIAVSNCRTDLVKKLLRHVDEETLMVGDSNQETAFHAAAEKGIVCIFKKMACISPQLIHQANYKGETPYTLLLSFLHKDAKENDKWGDVECAYEKIHCITGAKKAIPPDATALHIAIYRDKVDVAKALLKHVKVGEFLMLQNEKKENPLHIAVTRDNMLELWEDMVSKSPKIVEQHDLKGNTPLDLLRINMDVRSDKGQWEYVVDAYKNIPAAQNLILNCMGQTAFDKAINANLEDIAKSLLACVDEESFKQKGKAALFKAAENGMIDLCVEMVRISPQLINNRGVCDILTISISRLAFDGRGDYAVDVFQALFGEKMTDKDASIRTPLHMALIREEVDVARDLMSRNRENGFFIEHLKDHNGNTPLHLVVSMNMKDLCLEFFTHYDSNTLASTQNNRGETPLSLFTSLLRQCAQEGIWNFVTKVYEEIPFVTEVKVNNLDQTVLHMAVLFGNAEIAMKLLSLLNSQNRYILKFEDKNGDTALHIAIAKGMGDVSEKMVQLYPEMINVRNNNGDTAVHMAAVKGMVDVCEKMVSIDPEVITVCNNQGDTPLHTAAEQGMADLCEKMISQYPEVITVHNNNGDTPLHLAVKKGMVHMCEKMVSIYPDVINSDGNTLLHIAAMKGMVYVCMEMTNLHPEVLTVRNNAGDTPLHLAAVNGMTVVCVKMVSLKPSVITVPNNNGDTALHIATVNGMADVCEEMVDLKPTVIIVRNNNGDTPLHLAAVNGMEDVCMKMVSLKPTVIIVPNNNGDTALHIATANGMVDVCEKMIYNHPEAITVQNNKRDTSLHIAATMKGMAEVCEKMINIYPGLIGIPNIHGDTPLHIAVVNDMVDLCKKMVNLHPEVITVRNNARDTGLHVAAVKGMEDVCKEMVNVYPELITVQNNHGDTPLHIIVEKNMVDLCKNMASRHPEGINVRNNAGDTMVHVAAENGMIDVCEEMINIYPEVITTRNNHGDTPLHIAASKDMVDVCLRMLGQYPDVMFVRNNNGEIPLFGASSCKMLEAIYKSHNSLDATNAVLKGRNDGNTILHLAITKDKLELALSMIEKYPRLAKEPKANEKGETPLHILAGKPSTFESREPLGTMEYIVYSWLKIKDKLFLVENDRLGDPENPNDKSPTSSTDELVKVIEKKKMKHLVICKIVEELLNVDSWETYGRTKEYGETPLLIAARTGVTDMVKAILEKSNFRNAIHDKRPSDYKNVVMLAAENRHADIFEFLLRKISTMENANKKRFLEVEDKSQENALHLVAKRGSHRPLGMPGETMQLHWELKWYKYVRDNMPPHFSQARNREGKTPRDVFNVTHKDQIKSLEGGGEWLNKTSQSCSVVASLIAAVTFAAATTFPGGNSNEGAPNFLGKPAFSTFVISTFVALCLSLTSLIMFLTILISPYHDSEDFGRSLPGKLIAGVCALLGSIGAMLISFWAAHNFFLKGKLIAVALPIYIVVCLPILETVRKQIPFYKNLVLSLYKSKPRPWYRDFTT